MLRILASIVLLFSVLFLPFYISIILAIACIIYFSLFLEAIVLFLISDLLYGVKEKHFFQITLLSFFISILTLLIVEFLKRKLKSRF